MAGKFGLSKFGLALGLAAGLLATTSIGHAAEGPVKIGIPVGLSIDVTWTISLSTFK